MAGDNESVDRISGLPDDIRELIVGYLPITDAVRSSVLSRKWRNSWKRAVQLNIYFDEDLEKQMSEEGYYRIVGRVLLSHIGRIHKFVLIVTERSLEEDLNAWLESLSRKAVNDLIIQSGFGIENSELPPFIFQCLELSCLTLRKFNMKNSAAFRGFPNLVTLNLFYVDVYGDILEKIISSCPLEILFVEGCRFYSTWTDHSVHKTAISSSSLRAFNVVCNYQSLCYSYPKYTPNLRVASFMRNAPNHKKDHINTNCFDVMGSMLSIEEFAFDCRLHKTSTSDTILKKLSQPLVNLKTATLHELDVISLDKISFVFCIIRSSPNLQNLTIHMATWPWECFSMDSLKAALAFIEAEGKEEIKTNITTLSVTFEDPKCIGAETALIRNIVSWCPTLQNLFIKTSRYIKDASKLQLSRAVKKFGRSSSKPKIIYS